MFYPISSTNDRVIISIAESTCLFSVPITALILLDLLSLQSYEFTEIIFSSVLPIIRILIYYVLARICIWCVRVRACEHACVHACACVRVCMACVRVCMACARVCMCVRGVRACVCVRARARAYLYYVLHIVYSLL